MEKIWLKHYEEGVPAVIDVAPFDSLIGSFNNYTKKFADHSAFSNFGVKLTYRDLRIQVEMLAAYMQQVWGIKKGDRVAIMMPNLLQYPISLFAVLSVGAIVVNINPLYTPRELEHTLHDSGAVAIIICANFANTLEEVIHRSTVKHVMVTNLGDCLGVKGRFVNFAVKYIKKMVPKFNLPHAVHFNDALKKGASLTLEPVELTLRDLAFLQYTGGTTGPSKGAMLTHGNLLANATQCRAFIRSTVVPGVDVAVTPLPLYHIFSLTVCCLSYIGLGAECMLITNPRDLDGFIKILKKHPGTFFIGINTLYNGLVNHPRSQDIDFTRYKFFGSGGMATQHAVNHKWLELSGRHIVEGYGLTETSPVLTFSPPMGATFTGSCGIPLPNTEISIRDDAGNELGTGETGEVWARGPQVMLGYWNRPEETKNVLTEDGWFKTGDIGLVDKEGWLYLVDRKKDMVIVSGFNVYPAEVEDVLVDHEGVLEAAVIGIKAAGSGEAVKAFVVKNDPGLTEQDLISYCKKHLTAYKVPKLYEFRDELPKSNVGKVLRRMLRDGVE